jgi:hypothetical protein
MIRWVLCSLLLTSWLACENELADVQRLYDYPDPNIERVESPRITFSDSGVIQAYVRGPILHRKAGGAGNYTDMFIEGVEVEFLGEDGQPTSWLFADYGENRKAIDEVYVRDNVLLYNKQGDTLQSEDLYWDISESMLYTDKFARLRSQGKLFYGFGFKARDDFSEWEMKALKGVADVE